MEFPIKNNLVVCSISLPSNRADGVQVSATGVYPAAKSTLCLHCFGADLV